MPENLDGSPAQKSVTTIHPLVPRVAAVAVPILAAIALLVGGRDLAEAILLWGAVILLFLGVSALSAYMLTTGQFPPRMSKDAVDLSADVVDETGKSLDLVKGSVLELAERIERIEAHLGMEDE